MKPVEIEFLVKNNTRQGLSGVSGGIDAVDKDAAQARGRIQALKDEIVRLQKVIAQTPEMDQKRCSGSSRLCKPQPNAPIWFLQALRQP